MRQQNNDAGTEEADLSGGRNGAYGVDEAIEDLEGVDLVAKQLIHSYD